MRVAADEKKMMKGPQERKGKRFSSEEKLGRTTKKENLKTWEAWRLRVRTESKKIEKGSG